MFLPALRGLSAVASISTSVHCRPSLALPHRRSSNAHRRLEVAGEDRQRRSRASTVPPAPEGTLRGRTLPEVRISRPLAGSGDNGTGSPGRRPEEVDTVGEDPSRRSIPSQTVATLRPLRLAANGRSPGPPVRIANDSVTPQSSPGTLSPPGRSRTRGVVSTSERPPGPGTAKSSGPRTFRYVCPKSPDSCTKL